MGDLMDAADAAGKIVREKLDADKEKEAMKQEAADEAKKQEQQHKENKEQGMI